MRKVIFITGVSSGLGKACAEYLLSKGNIIFGTSRSASNISDGYDINKINVIPLELRDESSIISAINYVIENCGKIDVLINNAGCGFASSIEDAPIEKIKEIFNVNFFGNILMIKNILKIFSNQSFGVIVNISSIAGIFSLPFQGYYSATKFALEAISESLYMELKNTNIRIVLIEPGDLSTNFTNSRIEINSEQSRYFEKFKRAISVAKSDEKKGMDPMDVAKKIYKIINLKKPHLKYTIGHEAWYVVLAYRVLPDWLFFLILSRHYKI